MRKAPTNPAITDRTPVVLSARGKVLGRLATEIATILRGKDSVGFLAHQLSGRKVIVTNAKEFIVTGRKMDQKMYYSHSGYIGNLRSQTLKEKMDKPGDVIRHAVRGMLPDNRLRQHWLKNLEIREEE